MMSLRSERRLASRAALLTIALLAAGSAPASAIKVVGTDGRDEINVTDVPGGTVKISPAYAYVPPAAGTPDDGNCAATLAPVSALPDEVVCHPPPSYVLSIDLNGGDDELRVRTAREATLPGVHEALAATVTVDGGAGADDIAVNSPTAAPTIKGGDGDDVLAARGADRTGTTGPTFDGGPGRDLVDYANSLPDDVGQTEGVDADLTRGTARIVLGRLSTGVPTLTREDRLLSIERVAGTPRGDILTGGRSADELIGAEGPDRIDGREGDDIVSGGSDEDVVVGGTGRDTIDGGPGLDQFPAGSGGDTLIARDGAAEVLTCVKDDTVVDDLTDRLLGGAGCVSVSTAARSHVLDTVLTRRALTVGRDRGVMVAVRCPKDKAEACSGVLTLRVGTSVLAQRRFALQPRHATRVRLTLSRRALARARGRTVTLVAAETDDAGRPRSVTSRVRLR